MRFDEEGREVFERGPVEVPVGFRRPETLAEQVRRLVRNQFSMVAAVQGQETFEEANDFDVEEDDAELRLTGYEITDLQADAPLGVAEAKEEEEDDREPPDKKKPAEEPAKADKAEEKGA